MSKYLFTSILTYKSYVLLLVSMLLYCTGFSQQTTAKYAKHFDKQAHRGGAGLMPENTTLSAQNAVKFGATIEMDLYMSKDSQIVVTHDPHIISTYALYPDGKPIAKEDEKNLVLSGMDYADIRKFEMGMKLNPVYPQQKKTHACIPLLSELIDSAETYARVNHLPHPKYNIEPGPAYTITDAYREIFIKKMMNIIMSKKIQKRSIIQAFDLGMLQITHRLYPKMPIAMLVAKNDVETNLKKLTFIPAIYSPYYPMVTQAMVDECHKKGMKVLPWTVDTKKGIEDLKALGVDGIISDYPDLF